ncbi:MAG: ABC transporter ATP-binding protein [Acidimicrobiales bacterium]
MFAGRAAVSSLDLRVFQGEVFGLLGPNGAGKTTTIRVINTLLPVQEGQVEVLGHDVAREAMEVRWFIGYVPQMLSIEASLTGWENVMWFARLYDIPRRERKTRVGLALEAMGLKDAAGRLAGTFSGGMVRRLELAQALVNRPALLVLDEPTVGLGPIARDGVWQRVEELRRPTGITVLLTTHYMEEADRLCDRVALMHLGQKQAEGTPASLKAALGPNASLEDVFPHFTGRALEEDVKGGIREVRTARSTARRAG